MGTSPTTTAKTGIRFWILLSLLVLASLLFHATIWTEAPLRTPDSHGYLQAAQDLKDLRLETLPDRALGYPLLLVLAASAETPGQNLFILQMLLHFISVLLLVFVMHTEGLHKWLIVAFVVLASLPPSVAPAGYVLSETASEFTLTLAISGLLLWLAGRGGGWLILSLLFTVTSALVRPTYQLLGPILACTLMVIATFLPTPPKKRFRFAALWLFFAPSLLLSGIIVFNQQHYAFPGLTPLFGFNLTTRTIHFVERLPEEHAPIRDILIAHRDKDLVVPGSDHTGYMSVWMAIPELQGATGLSRLALSQEMLRLNLLLIRKAPLNYFGEVGRAIATYWMPTPPDLANCNSRILQLTWGLLILLILLLFVIHACTFSGLLLLGFSVPHIRDHWYRSHSGILAGIVVTLSVILYSMAVSVLVEMGTPRYRAPTELLIWFSILLGVEFWKRLRN